MFTNMSSMKHSNIGDIVQIGSNGDKGRIIDIIKPLETYSFLYIKSSHVFPM
jgi:hypothetical protein